MRQRLTALLALLAATAVLLGLTTGTAAAASGTYLRLAHLSPDTPTVDVTLVAFSGQTFHLNGVSYGDVSTYQTIEPGSYTVQMRPAGSPDAPPILTGTLQADAGHAYTAAALGPQAGATVRLLTDDLSLPGPGRARVRIVQGDQQAGSVAVTWNGGQMAGPVDFGSATGYVTVPAGRGAFGITPNGGGQLALPVDLAAGGVYSVIVVRRGGALAGQVQTDALGTGATPTGGIETGQGGMADLAAEWWPGTVAVLAMLLVSVAVVGAGVVARRRVDRRRVDRR